MASFSKSGRSSFPLFCPVLHLLNTLEGIYQFDWEIPCVMYQFDWEISCVIYQFDWEISCVIYQLDWEMSCVINLIGK